MGMRKDLESKTKTKCGQREAKSAVDFAFPSAQERLMPYEAGTPRRYQVVTGTGDELIAWF